MLEIKEFRCYEAKIEKSEKGQQLLSEGWWLSGCRSSVAEHWWLKPKVIISALHTHMKQGDAVH